MHKLWWITWKHGYPCFKVEILINYHHTNEVMKEGEFILDRNHSKFPIKKRKKILPLLFNMHIWLRFGIPVHPSLQHAFYSVIILVKHCGARGFRTYSAHFALVKGLIWLCSGNTQSTRIVAKLGRKWGQFSSSVGTKTLSCDLHRYSYSKVQISVTIYHSFRLELQCRM